MTQIEIIQLVIEDVKSSNLGSVEKKVIILALEATIEQALYSNKE